MVNLNEYIKEGLFDNIDKLEGKNGLESNAKQLKKDIIDWICSNYYNQPNGYKSHLVKKRDLQINMETIPPTVNYDAKNSLENRLFASNNITSLNNNGMFQWGTVTKDFICSNSKIETLEGSPKEVGGRFYCDSCKNLISLEGAPEKVNWFSCSRCDNLTSLKGVPKEVEMYFNCIKCKSLKSLKGAPEKVGRDFVCAYCSSLTSLKGAPKEVGGDFICSDCYDLKSLEGAPEEVSGSFNCSDCYNLKSLEGAPKEVGEDFCCDSKFTEDDVKQVSKVKGKIDC